jgi:hypothetical protein
MPELECHADEQTRIDPITLDAEHNDVSDVYRIRGGHLFITAPREAVHELDIRVTRFFCR